MKSLEEQLLFLDKEWMPLYGFKSIADHQLIYRVVSVPSANWCFEG
jgi:hypothetical protein